MRLLLYISIIVFSFSTYGQEDVGGIFEEMPNDSLPKRTLKTHSSLWPKVRERNSSLGENNFHFSPLVDLNFIQTTQSNFKTGLGIQLEGRIKNKFYYRLAGVEGISQTDGFYSPKTYIADSNGQSSIYSDLHGRISFTPNPIFNFQVGLDNNFIGEGARSMFLSDYGASFPFGQIRMRFWRIEYSILYQFMREKDISPATNRWNGKFSSSHHLSFNAAKWLNIGFFETVVFQPKDTLSNRGFEVEYLNPFIFYRPQEYSLGSSDNVLIGVELNAFWKKHTFYSQFIMDEFVLSEIKNKTGWWASKYGGQFGVKGRFNRGENKFFYRLEYNFARPYTYAHISRELNYGNQGTPLAHPYGASFMELLGEFKWQNNKMYAKIFSNYYLRGASTNGFNYGENIYDPYINRPYEYGHFIGQGEGYNGTKTILTFGYQVLKNGNLNAFVENHFNASTIDKKIHYNFVVGLRSMLWNDRRNY